MRAILLSLPLAALLAGCDARIDTAADGNDADGNVTIQDKGGQLALAVPGFSAKLAIPGLHFSPSDMDIDGLKLFPGARTTAMQIDAHDGKRANGDGTVRIDFTSDAPPPAVIGYYRGEAARAGYTVDATPAAGSAFSATKPKDDGESSTTFLLALHPAGAGSAGTVTIGGG